MGGSPLSPLRPLTPLVLLSPQSIAEALGETELAPGPRLWLLHSKKGHDESNGTKPAQGRHKTWDVCGGQEMETVKDYEGLGIPQQLW